MSGEDDYKGFGFDVPAEAATNIKGKFVPDTPDYVGIARGQLVTILGAMDIGIPITETDLEARVVAKGEKFSSQSFPAQVRNLRKPGNGAFCITTVKNHGVLTYTLYGKHGVVAKCDKCDFAPYHRLDAQDAVDLYHAAKNGEYEKIETYMAAALRGKGLGKLIEEEPEAELDLFGDDW